ncbi:hypothetical protein SBDP2_1460004 [Syntrophobacter sp. SbD2]|nr:hypothetical protein SBDP2_1460004 [Syntrophobacter sp. SbD2]
MPTTNLLRWNWSSSVSKTIEHKDLKEENVALRSQILEQHRPDRLIGQSSAIHHLHRIIKRVSKTDSTVLITGESGTGKELVANAIHYQSPRRDLPFVPINCGAIPEELLESELFGHEKGAFTGAFKERRGRFELANKGTVFLDEIGEMNSKLQVKLLRFLQETKFHTGSADRERLKSTSAFWPQPTRIWSVRSLKTNPGRTCSTA